MMGQTDKTLTCDVSGADNLDPTITYRWTRNGDPVTVPDSSSNTFSFSPLGLSQAGVYTCRVTVSSSLLNQNSNADAVNMQTVTIQGWLINNSSVSDVCGVILLQFQIQSPSPSLLALVTLLSVDLLLLLIVLLS